MVLAGEVPLLSGPVNPAQSGSCSLLIDQHAAFGDIKIVAIVPGNAFCDQMRISLELAELRVKRLPHDHVVIVIIEEQEPLRIGGVTPPPQQSVFLTV